jgi:hypothetical protein
MATRIETRTVCDRCGASKESVAAKETYSLLTRKPASRPGKPNLLDLCGQCDSELEAWLASSGGPLGGSKEI